MGTNTELVRNFRVRLANLNVDGQTGKVDAVQHAKDVFQGQYRVMVRLKGEKEFQLCSLADNLPLDRARPIIEDRIHEEYVTEWVR